MYFAVLLTGIYYERFGAQEEYEVLFMGGS